MPEDISAAERMVREWQERATEKAEKFGRMQAQIEQISVTESSRDGAVRVTVGSSGMLDDLVLAENAGNRPMAKLAGEIMRTVRLAQSKLPERMQEAAASTVGEGDEAVRHMLGQAKRFFPEPPEEPEEPPRRPGVQEMRIGPEDDGPRPPRRPNRAPRRPGPDDFDDEDFSRGSFLR
ncbi:MULTISPECIES: YbaB/EbfC family nucleoid-associated protein [unclassified Saccharopolyspora]|uniref:YbaB/EbfC family nucleoid-associated protein n=1 Tax=unclassified Saccharopolyspora TaxID=2646250 RepID=UPI001CD366EA|nr:MULTISPECIES: YbaB/EbfC family nucleoid-associated protein [unclassified Saccharopolyspora]MCA1191115.1 YbaB/EbfC family nucleoid-associated protein [Saccharopolyspora sp. 6V]MCA1225755.1 YbaB/EbfC family nucleoid-associated protein [Saccharopolyspora sp. 6M]MCA1278623.1 YbaB/EbfC family nucleoid-associated protein [Saccharopolyspora sp. 7B]